MFQDDTLHKLTNLITYFRRSHQFTKVVDNNNTIIIVNNEVNIIVKLSWITLQGTL